MAVKAYQCSQCSILIDLDETCSCAVGVDPRPNHRDKNSAEECHKYFKPLEKKKQWHDKFSWEQ